MLSTDTLSTEACRCLGKLPKMIRVEKEGRAGVEPATYRAATNCSTTELTPQRQPPRDRRPPKTTHASMLLRESQQMTHQAINPDPIKTTDDGTAKKCGGAGYRSLCLLHAKQALYHLSYTPKVGRNNLHRETRPAAAESKKKNAPTGSRTRR